MTQWTTSSWASSRVVRELQRQPLLPPSFHWYATHAESASQAVRRVASFV